ncbi:ArsI/CadI family heavy metal resistance metalloenzyme [methane-oxidizing endosymbiont of Gigantopelta aegis]|uniref:ArsI/CadI family heavy metal resistance metalloenzyme n=1 Tax=methane-oxidizing endosymbiont of Gigantopelta aegis TaxID=2794938 RepID=UPI0018DB4EC2|nr:ArsI/CadI family heavy metal resistance metalloenzyme [methane-oxidizing endosymbiont of Gigantopelta aegis]
MKRLHIHLAVEDLEQNIEFYSTLFGCQPIVVHDDYAKWMLDDPRVNFAISNRSQQTGLDHLGIQAENKAELRDIKQHLDATQAPIEAQQGAACCYTRSDKYWITDPQGIAWESFHSLNEIPTFNDAKARSDGENPYACRPQDEKKSSCCG